MAAEVSSRCSLVDLELDRQFGDPLAAPSPEALEHLRQCDRCRKLYECFSPSPSPAQPSPLTSARVEAALRASLKPVSPLPSLFVRTSLFLAIFGMVGLIKIALLGPAGYEQMSAGRLMGNLLVLLSGGFMLSLSLAAQMVPGNLRRFSSQTMAVLLAIGFFVGAALLTPWNASDIFVADGWPCFRAGALMALPVGFVYWLLVRRGRPLSAISLGGTLGAIAGLLGATVLQFTCSRQEVSHLLVWHGGVIVVSAILGVLIALASRHMEFGRA
jgi:hypothetical protein